MGSDLRLTHSDDGAECSGQGLWVRAPRLVAAVREHGGVADQKGPSERILPRLQERVEASPTIAREGVRRGREIDLLPRENGHPLR
jgi:hypothetical protein